MEKKDTEDLIEIVKKVTKTLVFDKFNIPFDVTRGYPNDPILFNRDFNFNIGIDVDRYLQKDKEYSKFINELYKKVYSSLRYVNLSENLGFLDYYYYNDSETQKKLQTLTNIVNKELKTEYNLTDEEIKEVNANYTLLTQTANQRVQFKVLLNGYDFDGSNYVHEKTRDKLPCRALKDFMLQHYAFFHELFTNTGYLNVYASDNICG